jgi:hypothetical protein
MRRLMTAVDAEAYGARPQVFQDALQKGLEALLDEAADRTRLRRTLWERQVGGDGEFAVLPEGEPEDVVVYRFVLELNAALAQYNRMKAERARIRLRLAVHFGPATPGPMGFSGSGPVVVNRLCGCEQAKEALRQTDAALVVVLSTTVYEDTVAAERLPLDPAKLRRIRVRAKELDEDAWLWLPGGDAHALGLDLPDEPPDVPWADLREQPEPAPAPERGKKDVPQVENFRDATINGPAIAGDATFNGPMTFNEGDLR